MNKYDFLALNNITYFRNKEKYKDFLMSTQKKLKENEFCYAFYDCPGRVSKNYEGFDTLTRITKNYLVHHYLNPYQKYLTVFIETKDKLYTLDKEHNMIISISVFDYKENNVYDFIKNLKDKKNLFNFNQTKIFYPIKSDLSRTYSNESFVLYHSKKEKFNHFFTKKNNFKIDSFKFVDNDLQVNFDRCFYDKAIFKASGFFSQFDFHSRIKKRLNINTIINTNNTIKSFDDFYNSISENLEIYKLSTDKNYKLALTENVFNLQNNYLKEIIHQKNNLIELKNYYIDLDVHLETNQKPDSSYNSKNNIDIFNDEFFYEENFQKVPFHKIKNNAAFESIKGLEQLLSNRDIDMDINSKLQLASIVNAIAKTYPDDFLKSLLNKIEDIVKLSQMIEKNIVQKTSTKKTLSL